MRADRRSLEPLFIVGQYKCGTSWLLRILSAHPQAVGASELDIIRATYLIEGPQARMRPVPDLTQRFIDGWSEWRKDDKSSWRGPEIRAALERGDHVPRSSSDLSRPRTCDRIPPAALRTFYRRLNEAQRPAEAMDAFLEAASSDAGDASLVVLKAADQIAVFDLLQTWQPRARKVVITRDGRDASISALHFRQLMRDLNAPFRDAAEPDYWQLLRSWAQRAEMVQERAMAGQLRVIRYEDLTRDLAGTLGPFLEWLGLDHSREVMERIDGQTSFEALTGRARGTEARAPRRKGAVGEWLQTLSAADKEQAWDIAGRQLAAFGYTRDGEELGCQKSTENG